MRSGLEVLVIYVDEHLVELRIQASNGEFAAQASVYANRDAPTNLAQTLRGFPAKSGDSREFQLGTFRSDEGGDGVQLRFYCTDAAGHAAVDVRVETKKPGRAGSHGWMATFDIPVEAAAVDAFVEQLARMRTAVGERAELVSTT